MNWKPLFVLTLILGCAFAASGAYYLFFAPPDISLPTNNPPDSSVNLSYTPEPSGKEVNPMFASIVLFPFVNGTDGSLLKLSVAGTFVSNPPQLSFLFSSSFNATILNRNNGSGNGVGAWTPYPRQTFDNKPGTTIEYLFTRTGTDQNPTSFTGALATLLITRLPRISEPGKYTVIFPFSYLGGGHPLSNGFFDLCPLPSHILTATNELYQNSPGVCSGGTSSYRFRINQTLQLRATFEDSSLEKTYSMNQTWGLFLLGVGIPAIISSIAFLNSGTDAKLDELAKLVKDLNEKFDAQQRVQAKSVSNEKEKGG